MMRVRQIVERLSRGKVLKRNIQVKGRSTPILVSPDAQLKYLKFGKEAFDQDLLSLAEKFLSEKSSVWDIGANVGVFTFAAAAIASKGTVLSVEADIWLAGLLRQTSLFEEYAEKELCILPAAISSENSVGKFMVAERGRASNALEIAGGYTQMGGVREMQYVPTLTLDTLLKTFPSPDFVKIDIEGGEYLALQGATSLLENIRPIFYLEVGSETFEDIRNLFHSYGYGSYDRFGRELGDGYAANMLFIHEAKELQ